MLQPKVVDENGHGWERRAVVEENEHGWEGNDQWDRFGLGPLLLLHWFDSFIVLLFVPLLFSPKYI